MPIFFVGYAVVMWVFIIRNRRTLRALIPLVIGTTGLLGINILHLFVSKATNGAIDLPQIQALMYPYTALVTGVGIWLALIPRRHTHGCWRCGYDLAGLSTKDPDTPLVCPECGEPQSRRNAYRPSGVSAAEAGLPMTPEALSHQGAEIDPRITWSTRSNALSGKKPEHEPEPEHTAWHRGQQDPAEQPETLGRDRTHA
ncbi:MAG: hypothetical protein AAGI17_09935 [Planctomycetota bacterium]